MSKDESDEERTAPEKFERSLREIEAAAAEIVEVGDLLFRGGEPSDPALLRRYRLYTRVKAALALPVGPERLGGLEGGKGRRSPEALRMNQPLVAEEGRSWRIISTQCVGYGKPLFLGGADEIWTSICTGILSDSFIRKSRGLPPMPPVRVASPCSAAWPLGRADR